MKLFGYTVIGFLDQPGEPCAYALIDARTGNRFPAIDAEVTPYVVASLRANNDDPDGYEWCWGQYFTKLAPAMKTFEGRIFHYPKEKDFQVK